ncbi:MAG: TlpA family protein disulfide reductase [Elusimicrobia bacterium]|nr:TlpA family protein disulfide reductase [Elusimicrobiota bacterium]
MNKSLGITAAAALAAVLLYVLSGGPRLPPPGDEAAPALSGSGLDGAAVSLSDFAGKVVLVDFWATWCDPCREEIPDLIRLRERFQGRGFEVLGASMDENVSQASSFVKTFGIRYPVILLGGERVPRGWIVPGLPAAYLVGRDGTILNRYLGAKDPETVARDVETALAR